jgi:hypothetical protein
MNEKETPDWLLEVQNKSWEPEILISGITLTFVFIFSNYIYNFYGMLIQDFGVFDAIAKTLYRISVIAITGLKIILILHLILRGLWTGVLGLSYVFPNGIKEEKLPKSQRKIIYDKPDQLVIKLEKICSILFSFIFSSIWVGIAIFLYFVPIVVLFIAGLDIYYISIISSIYSLITFVIIISILIFYKTKFKNSKILQKLENSIFENILKIYLTNIGKIKTLLIFLIYFLIIVFISRSAIFKFDFNNEGEIKTTSVTDIIRVDYDHYLDSREPELRFQKAVIDQYEVTNNEIKLFISVYKEDNYIVDELKNNPELFKESNIEADSTKRINISDLYEITIDDKTISGLRWYSTENINTNQEVIKTTIHLDTIENGIHELKINKIYLRILREKIKLIKNWDIIPFEVLRKK